MKDSPTDENTRRRWRIAHSEASLGWGGQEQRVFAELAGFRGRGNEVFLIAPENSQISARSRSAGIPVEPLPPRKFGILFSALRLARWFRVNRIDVLNTHSSNDGWFVALAGRLARVPAIIRTRHIDVSYGAPFINRHAFCTLADHVLTTSERIREGLIAQLKLRRENVTTLPTGIDVKRFRRAGEVHPALKPLRKSQRRLIGMVSVLRSWKGHHDFISAAAKLMLNNPQIHVVIAGDGPQRANIETWIAETGLPKRFHLLGHVEDVPSVLRGLHVLAIPSYGHEGVPQIGLQALACETPVVGSDVGGIPEIIIPGKTGSIFPARNVDRLAEELEQALARSQKDAELVKNGRELVEREHSIERMLDRTDDLYERLAAKRDSKTGDRALGICG